MSYQNSIEVNSRIYMVRLGRDYSLESGEERAYVVCRLGDKEYAIQLEDLQYEQFRAWIEMSLIGTQTSSMPVETPEGEEDEDNDEFHDIIEGELHKDIGEIPASKTLRQRFEKQI